jgi:hypothetical protein
MKIQLNSPSKLNTCERGGQNEGDILSSRDTKASKGHSSSQREQIIIKGNIPSSKGRVSLSINANSSSSMLGHPNKASRMTLS